MRCLWPRSHRVGSPRRWRDATSAPRSEKPCALRAHWSLGGAGVVVANPVPERAAIPHAQVEAWIADALEEAARDGVAGKAVTPWLLTRIGAASGGRTLAANLALLEDNARVAAAISGALAGDAGGTLSRARRR